MNTWKELREHAHRTPDGWAVEVYPKIPAFTLGGDWVPLNSPRPVICQARTIKELAAEVVKVTFEPFTDDPRDSVRQVQRDIYDAMYADLWIRQELAALHNPGFMVRLLETVWRRAERDLDIALVDMGPIDSLVNIANDIAGGGLQVDILARYHGEASGCTYWATVSRGGQIGRVANVTDEFREYSRMRALFGR